MERSTERISSLLVENVNHFGDKRGFIALISRLQTAPAPSVAVLQSILLILSKVAIVLSRPMAETLVPVAVDAAVAIISNMDTQVRSVF